MQRDECSDPVLRTHGDGRAPIEQQSDFCHIASDHSKHIPLVFRIGRPEWMGVVEALCVSGVCLVLARRPGARLQATPPGADTN